MTPIAIFISNHDHNHDEGDASSPAMSLDSGPLLRLIRRTERLWGDVRQRDFKRFTHMAYNSTGETHMHIHRYIDIHVYILDMTNSNYCSIQKIERFSIENFATCIRFYKHLMVV